MEYICAVLLSFFIYAFAGWVWESFVCPIVTRHKIHNSGFLSGPVVPIYGVGALVVSLLFTPDESFLSVFLEGGVIACIIEYLTSWGMEKIYHRRWWDYSTKAFNINGRVCLEGFICFGGFSIVAVKYVQPALLNWLETTYSLIPLVIMTTICITLFSVDFGVTIAKMAHLEEHMEAFKGQLLEEANKLKVEIDEGRFTSTNLHALLEKHRQLTKSSITTGNKIEQRILKAFPHLLNNDHTEK